MKARGFVLAAATLLLMAFGCEQRQAGQGIQVQTTATAKAATSASASATAAEVKPTTPGVTATSIKLGSWGPLSGPAAAWGAVLHGMNAYFQHINDKGGIHGRRIEFLYRDDQYDPAKTPAVVRELVENENVFAMVGGIGTATSRAVASYLEKKGVPLFSPASGDKYWTAPEGPKNLYTVYPRYATEGEILGEHIAKELKAKKVAVLYQNDDFGQQGAEGIKKAVAKHEGTEVVAEISCLPTDTDLSGHISQIVEKAPDVLAIFASPKQAVAVVKGLDEQKKKPQIVTSFVLGDPIMFKLAGDTWNGTITSAVMKLSSSDDESVKLYREVIEKHGAGKLPVGTFTEAGFLFAMPFVEALHRAGKDLTREKLYKALNAMKGWTDGGPYWQGGGLGAAVTFGEDDRLGSDQIFLAQAKDGQWEKITDWLSLGGDEDKGEESDQEGDEDKEGDGQKTDAKQPDPQKPDPQKPDPQKPDPQKPDLQKPQKPELAKPDPPKSPTGRPTPPVRPITPPPKPAPAPDDY